MAFFILGLPVLFGLGTSAVSVASNVPIATCGLYFSIASGIFTLLWAWAFSEAKVPGGFILGGLALGNGALRLLLFWATLGVVTSIRNLYL